jgi:hypothetical protein
MKKNKAEILQGDPSMSRPNPSPGMIQVGFIAQTYPSGVPDTEFSREFLQGMVSRMSASYFKYGAVAEGFPVKIDAVQTVERHIAKYRETRNTEHLIDAANYLMIEFMHPRLDGAFFQARDSKDSAGRVWATGHIGQDSNTHATENVRQTLYKKDGD